MKQKSGRPSDRLRRYGVSEEQFEFMMEFQGGKCAICRKPFSDSKHTHVDHHHMTKVVRGVLCRSCNHGIGNFMDDPELLVAAIDYLRIFSEKMRVGLDKFPKCRI